ncbi:MAG: hypothetical protein AB7U59_00115 [Desulfovibrionaceae bacterium]
MRGRPAILFLAALLAWLGCGLGQAWGDEAIATRLEAARTAYAAGRFAAAGASLDAAYREGARNAALCLAAARTWDQAGDKSRSVRWLVRAHRLDPSDTEAGKALTALGVRLPGPSLPLGSRLSPRALVWLALAANSLFWLALTLARCFGRAVPRRCLALAGLLTGWLWLEAGLAVFGPRLWPVGVVAQETAVLCAPEAGAEAFFRLPAGEVVTLGPLRDGFRRVTAAPDRLGWVPTQTTPPAEP